MLKKQLILLSVIVFLIYIIPESPEASDEQLSNRDLIYDFLQSAYLAQLSLSELDRNMEEIELILDQYFTKDYQQKFLNENLFEENGYFFTNGTDFGEYFIPFFQFSEYTKVVIHPEEIYVFEYFPKNQQGPVGYDAHYEGILIEKIEDQWKISEYLYNNIPKTILYDALNKQ